MPLTSLTSIVSQCVHHTYRHTHTAKHLTDDITTPRPVNVTSSQLTSFESGSTTTSPVLSHDSATTAFDRPRHRRTVATPRPHQLLVRYTWGWLSDRLPPRHLLDRAVTSSALCQSSAPPPPLASAQWYCAPSSGRDVVTLNFPFETR